MKYVPLKTEAKETKGLAAEYDEGREIGVVRLGREHLFFRRRWRIYYIAYDEIARCFRRVVAVQAKMCCGKGELQMEYLVVCDEEKELAVIQLPGTRAAEALMEEMISRTPNAKHCKSDAQDTQGEEIDP